MAEIPPRDPRKEREQPAPPDGPARPPQPGPEVEPGRTQPAEAPVPSGPDEITPPGAVSAAR